MTLHALSLAGFLLTSAFAFEIPPNDGFVTDAAHILTESEEQELEADLAAYKAETTNEIAVVIVSTLGGESAADAALEIGRAWGVGSAKDNGLLLLVSYEDRDVFLATGYGLEGAIPDIVAKGIVDSEFVPRFREGKFAEGIRSSIDVMKKHIGGEYTAERYAPEEEGGGWPFLAFAVFFLIEWFLVIMARTKSWWLGGLIGAALGIGFVIVIGFWLAIPLFTVLGLLLDFVVSKNYRSRGKTKWWAGGGFGPGGGGRGGGFGGFGGGSFGGGGAGGKW